MMMIGRLVFFLSIQYVHMINVIQVRVSNDSSNSWIVQYGHEGFIIDCGCYWEHGILLGETWLNNFPNDTLPSFIFLTHTHPDNFIGYVSLLNVLNTTKLPIYVSNTGALNEMNYWLEIWRRVNPFETSILLDKRQSPDQFLYNNHIKVLDRPLKIFHNHPIHIISNFPIAESIYASMIYIPSIQALFTGDLVVVRSHLFVSPSDSYPDSDNHVCDWIGILQSLTCTFPDSTRIYPAHGDGPSPMSFTDTIETNIRWLTSMRTYVFNSCNLTYVMRILDDMFPNYSNLEQARASIATRMPQSAMAMGCKCSQNSPNKCGGLQPPQCQFIPKNNTQSLETIALPVACMRNKISSSSVQYLKIERSILFIILLTNIF